MKDPIYHRLLKFLTDLEEHKITYSLNHVRDEAVMVEVAIPGQRWEVEFLADGTVDVERFISAGLSGDEALDELFAVYAE